MGLEIPTVEAAEVLLRVARGEIKPIPKEEGDWGRWSEGICLNLPYDVDGWEFVIFFDCGDFDYIDSITAPDGRCSDFDDYIEYDESGASKWNHPWLPEDLHYKMVQAFKDAKRE